MFIEFFALSASLSLAAMQIGVWRRRRRKTRALTTVCQARVVVDNDQNIQVSASIAKLQEEQKASGRPLTGKQARFMKLLRIVRDGPQSVDEIRFLFAEGIEPVIRPDGVVYVPCIENEHLYMEGELDLQEEDLDRYVAQGLEFRAGATD